MKTLKAILTYFTNIVLILLIAIGLIVGISLLPIKNNYRFYSVMSGSMAPAIKTGSVVLVKPFPNYNAGDIITFKGQTSDKEKTTTHRIKSTETYGDSKIYTTAGDANDTIDSIVVTDDIIIGKIRLAIPYLGYLLGYIKTLPGLIILIVIPATVIVYEESKKIHREAKLIIKKRRERKAGKSPNKEKIANNKKSNNQTEVGNNKGENNETS